MQPEVNWNKVALVRMARLSESTLHLEGDERFLSALKRVEASGRSRKGCKGENGKTQLVCTRLISLLVLVKPFNPFKNLALLITCDRARGPSFRNLYS